MDLSELTKIVFERIKKLDPVNVSKILGFILLKEPSEQEMVMIAFGPENILLSKIDEAKAILGFLSPNIPAISSQKQSVLDALPVTDQRRPPPLLQNFSFALQTYPDSIREDHSLCNQAQFLHLKEKMDPTSSVGNYNYYQDASFNGSLSSRISMRSANLPEIPIKACHYFYKGYCKHGSNCRYYHGQSFSDGSSQSFCSNFNEPRSEENGLSPRSIEKLEKEIIDLLKSQRGLPVSISLLPMLYYEKYGRILHADGCLTESQWHGKPGFSLTKLLARLRSSIYLINRPRGQYSIILAEHVPKYLEYQHERSESVASFSSSHEIYLTFQADSAFNEDDVFCYFKQFGPVNEVRIPYQKKRTYGFVSFFHPETVCELLMMRNDHYIRGSCVLVKPCMKKLRMVDRPYTGKNNLPMPYPHQYVDLDSEPLRIPRKNDSSRIIKLNIEEQQKMIELERNWLAHFNLVHEPPDQQPSFSHGVEDSKLLEDPNHFPLEDPLGFTPVDLNTGLSNDVKTRNSSNNYSSQGSGHIELPHNPFAFSPSGGSSL